MRRNFLAPVETPKYRAEGARLKEARKLLHLTQDELAERIGSSLAAVKSWERGNSQPNRQFARRLGTMGVNLDYLSSGEGEPLIPPAHQGSYARMLDRALEGAAHVAMEPVAQLRSSTQVIVDLCGNLDFTPPLHWVVLVQELMVMEGLSERGARRILETLKEDMRQ